MPADVAQPVTLKWSMWANAGAESQGWQAVADMVHAQYPNITLKLTTAPWNDYWTKLPTQIAGGQSPCVVGLQSSHTAGFSQYLQPLDPQLTSLKLDKTAFNAGVLGALSDKGQQYALPYDFGPTMIFYNKDQFVKANVPLPVNGWTTDTFLKDAQALTKGSQYGFALDGAISSILAWAPGVSGVVPVTPDGKADMTNPKTAEALQWYADLISKYHVSAPATAASTESPIAKFLAGNASMMVTGPWDMLAFKESKKFAVGVVQMPAGAGGAVTTIGGSGFGISKQCKNADAAARAIAAITGPKIEAYLGDAGRAFPARTSEQRSWYKNAVTGSKEALDAADSNAKPALATANWAQADKVWSQGITTVLNGQSSVTDFLKTVQAAGE